MEVLPANGPARPLVAIVDDDQSVARAITRLVRHLGMDAQAFGSGGDFLDQLDATPCLRPDCVVLDVQMPGLGGLEVQERLSQRHVDCGVIIMTAYHDPEGHQRALAVGAVAILSKPFDAHVFVDAVNRALTGWRARRGRD
jgi:FixJ family two-component response regulator